ncbi:MAG: hypothetical protein U1F67_15910 [Rubrivivax sp.]
MSELMPWYLLGSSGAGIYGLDPPGPRRAHGRGRTQRRAGAPARLGRGYRSMTTVEDLFTAGGVGASGHKFSSGSHAEGHIATKAMVKYALDNKGWTPTLDTEAGRTRRADLQAGAHLPAQGLRPRSTSTRITPKMPGSGCRRSWTSTSPASPPTTTPTTPCSR